MTGAKSLECTVFTRAMSIGMEFTKCQKLSHNTMFFKLVHEIRNWYTEI